MYGYIYDVFLHQKPYEKELIRLENALTDKDLKGPIIRLSLINNVAHAVDDLLRRGMKTIVAVGSDQLFSKIADEVSQCEGLTLGLIPFGSHNQLAQLFGIPEGAEAVQVLAARLLRTIVPARINNGVFLHTAQIRDSRTKITLDERFSLHATTPEAMITIYNESLDAGIEAEGRQLAVTIAPMNEKRSFRKAEELPATTIRGHLIQVLEPAGVPIVVDGQKIINTPVTMYLSDKPLSVIVGKARQIT